MHHGIAHMVGYSLHLETYPSPATDIWWSSLEIFSNLFTWGPTHPLLTSCGAYILLECCLVHSWFWHKTYAKAVVLFHLLVKPCCPQRDTVLNGFTYCLNKYAAQVYLIVDHKLSAILAWPLGHICQAKSLLRFCPQKEKYLPQNQGWLIKNRDALNLVS